MSKVLEISKKLIKIKSTTGNTKALNQALNIVLAELSDFTIEKFNKDNIPSALIYNSKRRPKKFRIILNGHLDVIDGKQEQFTPKIIGNKLYGIGSMDMKSNVVCLMTVFKQIAKDIPYPIALQVVTDEQTGSLCGTKYQIDKGVKADFVIIGETTNFNIVNQSKGILWIKISAQGKSSHSAYPWQGPNAILEINNFLNKLKSVFPLPESETYETTVSVSNIYSSNKNYNKIPENCELWLDVRYAPQDSSFIKDKLLELIPEALSKKIVYKEPPLNVDSGCKDLKALRKSCNKILGYKPVCYMAHGTSDATYYSRKGMTAIEFGPKGMVGNTSNEYVEIESLNQYIQILIKFLLHQAKE